MFATNLRNLRMKSCQTQERMSKVLNISRATYGRYETGEREPDFSILEKISEYFNVSIDFLIKQRSEKESFAKDQNQPLVNIERLQSFIEALNLCGITDAHKNVYEGEYSAKESLMRLGESTSLLFMATRGSSWIAHKPIRKSDVHRLNINGLFEEKLKDISNYNRRIPQNKKYIRFLLLDPKGEDYYENPEYPCNEIFKEYARLANKYNCFEVKLYQKRMFRLQIENDSLAIVSKCGTEDNVKIGEERPDKPFLIIKSTTFNGQDVSNSLVSSFATLFYAIWNNKETRKISEWNIPQKVNTRKEKK